MSKKKSKTPSNTIAQNKRAGFEYHLSDKFEAGLVLHGWEVKSLRMGRGQITDAFVVFTNGEAWLMGSQIQALNTVSTHHVVEPNRARKLLLHAKELAKIQVATQQKGLTCVCTSIYWKQHLVKVQIALAKGKQQHDKRQTEKDRDWNRQKQRVMSKTV